MVKEYTNFVKSSQEMEEEKIRELSSGPKIVFENENIVVLSKKVRRTWFWLLVFWPMLFFKVKKVLTIM